MEGNYWTDRKARLRRRKLLGGTAVGAAGLAGLAFVGCGDDDEDASPTTSTGGNSEPVSQADPLPDHPMYKGLAGGKRGGKYVFYQSDAPTGFDPHFLETPGTHSMVQPSYNGLFMLWPTDPVNPEVKGELIASYEQPSDLEYVFKLRKGVKYHNVEPTNGREFTAEDVAFNIKRMQDPSPENRMRGMFTPVSTEVVDKHTIKIKLAEPFAPLLVNLANTWAPMVSREVVEADDINSKAVGTGGFIIDKYDRGVSVTWKRNPDYWKVGLPFVDSMEMQIIPDRALREAKFLSKDLDNGQINVTGTNEETIQKQKDEIKAKVGDVDFRETNSSFVAIVHMYFNLSEKPFDDIRVRQAIQKAISYDNVIKLFAGRAIRTGPISSGNPPWGMADADLVKFDAAGAKGLLSQAGMDTVKSELWVSSEYSGAAFAPLVQGLLKPLGIDMQIKQLENAQWLSEVYRGLGKYPATTHADATFDDPDRILYEYFHSKGANNHIHLNDPKMDELALKQRRELDTKARKEAVLEAQRYILAQAYDVPIVSPGGIQVTPPWLHSVDIRSGISDSYRVRDVLWVDGGPRGA